MLTLHQLSVLVTVADEGSVRGAAERLVVTQPAVSASLGALEREMGVSVFARAGRGIVLTDAGETLVRYARQILGLVDEAVSTVAGRAPDAAGTVRLGVSTAVAHYLVGHLLAKLNDLSPRLGIELEVGNRVRVWQLLTSRTVDLAVAGPPPSSGEFTVLARRANELILVCQPGAVWSRRLGDATWLVREPGSGTRAACEEVIALLGIDPQRVVIGSNQAIKTAAEAGLGVALLPRDAVSDSIAERHLTRIDATGTPLRRAWCIVARSGEELTAPARRWLEHVLAQRDAGFTAAGSGGPGAGR